MFDVFYIALKTSWDPYYVERIIVETTVTRDTDNLVENRLNWVVLTCQTGKIKNFRKKVTKVNYDVFQKHVPSKS